MLLSVADGAVRKLVIKAEVPAMLFRSEQGDLIAANDADEGRHVEMVGLTQHASHHVVFALG